MAGEAETLAVGVGALFAAKRSGAAEVMADRLQLSAIFGDVAGPIRLQPRDRLDLRACPPRQHFTIGRHEIDHGGLIPGAIEAPAVDAVSQRFR